MKAIAEAGRGDYIFIKDATSIAPVFGELLGGLITVAAQDINVNLTPLNGSFITAVQTGGIVQGSESNWTVVFDNLFAQETRDILVDMNIPALASATVAQKVLRVDISYFDPVSRAHIVLDPVTLAIDRTLGERGTDDVLNLEVEVTRLTFLVSKEIQRALGQKEAFDTQGATATLDALLTRISISPARDDPRVQALKSDVESVQEVVAREEELTPVTSTAIASSASSLGSQRATSTSGFASTAAPAPTAAVLAADASAFVAESPSGR
ncbi:unnamed protein product [Ostreobium quekettii]|uniref:Uncharacterized protein n=1 Tax=Ostreobium quekettii TaxID=121088 RepID=A0A8S1J1U4_9CHLO|nr:unnamed protein product [Ostreobium quekettii]|eukprot:evm.model.scf_625.3 EVM.evm.TU.scf_625.3   scf_625:35323-39828(-)